MEMEVVVTTGAIRRAKHQSDRRTGRTGRLPVLYTNQQCQSTEGKSITLPNLLTSSSPGDFRTLSLITKGYWLLWGGGAKPLVSQLMLVPTAKTSGYLGQDKT